eukprot:scaffold59223_cov48-Phaeocystis_antarctica.AAC.4
MPSGSLNGTRFSAVGRVRTPLPEETTRLPHQVTCQKSARGARLSSGCLPGWPSPRRTCARRPSSSNASVHVHAHAHHAHVRCASTCTLCPTLWSPGPPRLVALAVLRSDLNGGEHADSGPEQPQRSPAEEERAKGAR